MGIDTSEPRPAGCTTRACGSSAAACGSSCPWPELASYPAYGLVRPRSDFDDLLARQAVKAGAVAARAHQRHRPGARRAHGRITGVTAKGEAGEVTYRAPLVVAADGNSSRLSLAMGLHKRDDRPMGVAVRTYYTSPRHDDDWLESWLELWDRAPTAGERLLPGYGWIFGVGDGTCNVGLGILNTSTRLGQGRLQGPAQALARPDARGVGLPRGEPHPAGPRRRAADGLQPPAALHRRAAARRRLRRHGQPVQRRGHRLRDGVRRARRRGHRARRWPARPPTPASGRCRPTRRPSSRPTAATTRSAGCS